ncbi:hypothetical protein [Aphanothece sacrum]|uniref:Protein kinase n=1 Tax=Aphanothece sacrum FPU1 TaxID=1920663 RepID=A0A401IN81_APHSA|nr:hypothetical protein [Aphanothece sacrum]GBF82705.1 protein kinase [Aphanothece sacrum FPU1]
MSNDNGGFGKWFARSIGTIISGVIVGVIVFYLTEARNPQPNTGSSPISGLTTKSTPSPQTEIPLITSKANYTRLRDLLAQDKWKEANLETFHLIERISNSEKTHI